MSSSKRRSSSAKRGSKDSKGRRRSSSKKKEGGAPFPGVAQNARGDMVMPKDWEAVQLKTFTLWTNAQLHKAGYKVENLMTDLADGIKLIKLIAVISDDTLPIPEKKPKIRVKQLINCQAALKYLKEKGVVLNSIGAEDIVEGNQKLIMGMIWTIIHDFTIADISVEQLTAKEALLLWCQKQTAGYKGVNITNFHTSWADGLAFMALVHKQKPKLFEWKGDASNPQANLKKAFDLALSEFDIPRLLDERDMLDIRPDEKSMMTYIAEFYRTFAGAVKKEKAIRRIGKLVELTESNDALRADYARVAPPLVEWLDNSIATHSDTSFDNTPEDVKRKMAAFDAWKSKEKPRYVADKLLVEQIGNNLQLSLSSNSRPPFAPPPGQSVESIETKWNAMEEAQQAKLVALKAESVRQETMEALARRYKAKLAKLTAWLDLKEKYVAAAVDVDSLNTAKLELQFLDAFDDEHEDAKSRFQALEALSKEIVEYKYRHADSVAADAADCSSRFAALPKVAEKKRAALEDSLKVEQKKEAMRNEWSTKAQDYVRWAKDSTVECADHNFGSSLKAVTAYGGKLDKIEADLQKKRETDMDALVSVWGRIEEMGVTGDLKYTVLTMEDITSETALLDEGIATRRKAWEGELDMQQRKDAKKNEYEKVAAEYNTMLKKQRLAVENVTGTPEEKIAKLKAIYDSGDLKAKLARCTELETELKAFGSDAVDARSSRRNSTALGALSSTTNQLDTFVVNYMAALEDEAKRNERRTKQQAEWDAKNKAELLRAEFASKAHGFVTWVDSAIEVLSEPLSASNLDGAKKAEKEYKKTSGEFIKYKKEFDSLSALNNRMSSAGIDSAHGFTFASIEAKWNEANSLNETRGSDVQAEIAKQKAHEELRLDWAKKAKNFNKWLDKASSSLAGGSGDLKKQLANLKRVAGTKPDGEGQLGDLKELAGKMEDIKENKHSEITLDQLNAKWETWVAAADKQVTALENEIIRKELGGVTDAQLKEFKASFDFFDKDNSGELSKVEFRGVLQSLGEDVDDDEFEAILQEVDKDGDSTINFEEFTKMMVKRTEDRDTEDEVIAAFSVLAKGEPLVNGKQLDESGLKENHVKYLKKNMAGSADGGFDYGAWVKAAFAR